ncbi:Mth938-like domain-containing protein [Chromatium okenii]|uniref:Mth938-like domain-containing protein n=1 Tax=Chromatium okenii TaxID=61644 RepID=UPI0026E9C908|nr:Mth938-like domain-containing protein [Chromatium okenii]MBV5310546.1 Mth938-like domain-containing protein [Chromatium okenii]
MRFSEADNANGYLIDAYDTHGVVIGKQRYAQGLIVTPTQIIAPWSLQLADLTAESIDELLAFAPQIIVLGTGSRQVFPDPILYFAVLERGIGFEVMDTGAACRTYNILVSEGRRVVAGLMPFSL